VGRLLQQSDLEGRDPAQAPHELDRVLQKLVLERALRRHGAERGPPKLPELLLAFPGQ